MGNSEEKKKPAARARAPMVSSRDASESNGTGARTTPRSKGDASRGRGAASARGASSRDGAAKASKKSGSPPPESTSSRVSARPPRPSDTLELFGASTPPSVVDDARSRSNEPPPMPAPIVAPAAREVARMAPRREQDDEIVLTGTTDEGTVLVTGICGRLGRLLARELHRERRVVGIDRRPFPDAPKDIVHYRLDVRRKKTKDVFRQERVRAVVHLGVMHDPRSHHRLRHSWNVVAFQKLLEYMEQYQVPKLVVLSSANVYGPQPDNPQFLTEEAPLLGSQDFYAIRDLVELDMLAQSYFWRNPDTETVILRPCHILGSVRNAPSNYLRLERPITIMGFDPMVQVIHERDVVRAILRTLEPGVRGIFNLRGPGEMPLSTLLARAGRKPLRVPGPLASATIAQAFRFRLSSFPSPELDHIRYLCMVDDSRARETLGFAPQYGIDEAIEACLDA